MDFKLVSKNSLGAIVTLFLVILLGQSRFFDFLIDTALGRAILVFFIVGISITNKILGVVAVLFIIIAFNNSNIGYLEGFTSSPNVNEKINQKPPKQNDIKENVNEKNTQDKSIEGFNIVERELLMLQGKRSSEVPVYPNARNQHDNIEATDKFIFVDNYSTV